MNQPEVTPEQIAQIERIVRQVLAERTRPGATAGLASSARLELASRVITTAELDGRLQGVATLVVPRRAIVTPAARDVLKQHNVTLTYAAAPATSRTTVRLVIGLADSPFDPAGLVRSIGGMGLEVEQVAQTGLVNVVRKVCEHVGKGGQLGLLLSGRPIAAACLANRHKAVRAAAVSENKQVREAMDTIGVNLLAVNPTGKGAFELERMVHTFVAAGPRDCPADLQTELT